MSQEPFLSQRFEKNKSVVFRKIGEEYILVPIHRQFDDVDGVFSLNGTGAWIWELIDGERPVSEIKDSVLAKYEVDPETANLDVDDFFHQLVRIGAIAEVR
jgi:hypothetical protein